MHWWRGNTEVYAQSYSVPADGPQSQVKGTFSPDQPLVLGEYRVTAMLDNGAHREQRFQVLSLIQWYRDNNLLEVDPYTPSAADLIRSREGIPVLFRFPSSKPVLATGDYKMVITHNGKLVASQSVKVYADVRISQLTLYDSNAPNRRHTEQDVTFVKPAWIALRYVIESAPPGVTLSEQVLHDGVQYGSLDRTTEQNEIVHGPRTYGIFDRNGLPVGQWLIIIRAEIQDGGNFKRATINALKH